MTSTSPALRQTQILIPNLSAQGINLAASATFFFYSGAWRKVGQPITVDFGDTYLTDAAYLIVRNNRASDLRLRISGAVSTGGLSYPVDTLASGPQDNCFSTGRPVPVALSASGLVDSGSFRPSASPAIRKDQLLVFDNAAAGYNKSTSATYYYYNGAWRKVGASVSASFDADTLAPDAGFIIRKAAAVSSPDWTAAPTFPKL